MQRELKAVRGGPVPAGQVVTAAGAVGGEDGGLQSFSRRTGKRARGLEKKGDNALSRNENGVEPAFGARMTCCNMLFSVAEANVQDRPAQIYALRRTNMRRVSHESQPRPRTPRGARRLRLPWASPSPLSLLGARVSHSIMQSARTFYSIYLLRKKKRPRYASTSSRVLLLGAPGSASQAANGLENRVAQRRLERLGLGEWQSTPNSIQKARRGHRDRLCSRRCDPLDNRS